LIVPALLIELVVLGPAALDLGPELNGDVLLEALSFLLEVEDLVLELLDGFELSLSVGFLRLGTGRLSVEIDQARLDGVLLLLKAICSLLPVMRLLLGRLSLPLGLLDLLLQGRQLGLVFLL